MMCKTVAAEQVVPGMAIVFEGCKWNVRESLAGRVQTPGSYPRQIIVADVQPEDAWQVGVYAQGLTLELERSSPVQVIRSV